MIKAIAFVVLGFLLSAPSVSAISPPILSSPTNNSTISSGPKLTWQQVTDSIQYRVIVDDESSIKSPYIKNYYLTNVNYSPQLNPGIYYWKVGAKDSSDTWFWSEVWSFTLSTSSSPTSTPSPTPSPSPSPTSTSPFIISNIPSNTNSDQSFVVSANLSLSNNPNTSFYLKGAFKKIDSSNYFGKTLVSGSWVKNNNSYSEQYKITTDSSGNWSGNLEVQPDNEDSGFTGTGDYLFKVGRYTQSGSGPTWSNETTIKIASVTSTEQGGVITTTSSIVTPQTSPSSSSKISLVYRIATVAGESTASATPSATPATEVKSQKQTNILTIIGIVTVIIGTITLGYAIYNWFRLRNKEVS